MLPEEYDGPHYEISPPTLEEALAQAVQVERDTKEEAFVIETHDGKYAVVTDRPYKGKWYDSSGRLSDRDIYDRSTYDPAKHLQAATEYINLMLKMEGLSQETRHYGIEETESDVKDCSRKLWTAQNTYDDWVTTAHVVGLSDDEYHDYMNDVWMGALGH